MPRINDCAGADDLNVAKFGEIMCKQPGMQCGDQLSAVTAALLQGSVEGMMLAGAGGG